MSFNPTIRLADECQAHNSGSAAYCPRQHVTYMGRVFHVRAPKMSFNPAIRLADECQAYNSGSAAYCPRQHMTYMGRVFHVRAPKPMDAYPIPTPRFKGAQSALKHTPNRYTEDERLTYSYFRNDGDGGVTFIPGKE